MPPRPFLMRPEESQDSQNTLSVSNTIKDLIYTDPALTSKNIFIMNLMTFIGLMLTTAFPPMMTTFCIIGVIFMVMNDSRNWTFIGFSTFLVVYDLYRNPVTYQSSGSLFSEITPKMTGRAVAYLLCLYALFAAFAFSQHTAITWKYRDYKPLWTIISGVIDNVFE